MQLYLIFLRAIHIFSGVFWAGSILMIAGFVTPAAQMIGPDGGKFVQTMVKARYLTHYLTVASILSTISGILLFWRNSGGFTPAWVFSPMGMSFTIGGLAGIAAFALGLLVSGPTARSIGVVAGKMQTAGAPPKPEQLAEMQTLQTRLANAGNAGALLLSVAVIGMAIAQYLY